MFNSYLNNRIFLFFIIFLIYPTISHISLLIGSDTLDTTPPTHSNKVVFSIDHIPITLEEIRHQIIYLKKIKTPQSLLILKQIYPNFFETISNMTPNLLLSHLGNITSYKEDPLITPLIEFKLLSIHAQKIGFTKISDKDIKKDIKTLAVQFPSPQSYKKWIKDNLLSERSLNKVISDQYILQRFISLSFKEKEMEPKIRERNLKQLIKNLRKQYLILLR